MTNYTINHIEVDGRTYWTILNNDSNEYFNGYDFMGSVNWTPCVDICYWMSKEEAMEICRDLNLADEPAEPETNQDDPQIKSTRLELDTHDKLNAERSDTHMTKIDAIKTLTDNGIFELAQEIIDIIKSDDADKHATANRDILNLINRVNQMNNWTQFSWKEMIDLTTQAYGFTKFAAYNNLDVCADVYDQIDELHTILWNNFSSMKIWND